MKNERLRASKKLLSRRDFLQVRDRELDALFTLGHKLFGFHRELLPHFSMKIPAREWGLCDQPVQNYSFSALCGINLIQK